MRTATSKMRIKSTKCCKKIQKKSNQGWLAEQCIKFPAYLITFSEEILNGKLHFLCNES